MYIYIYMRYNVPFFPRCHSNRKWDYHSVIDDKNWFYQGPKCAPLRRTYNIFLVIVDQSLLKVNPRTRPGNVFPTPP